MNSVLRNLHGRVRVLKQQILDGRTGIMRLEEEIQTNEHVINEKTHEMHEYIEAIRNLEEKDSQNT